MKKKDIGDILCKVIAPYNKHYKKAYGEISISDGVKILFDEINWTGLNDKLGKKIYNGSRIENAAGVQWWVEWDEEKARYVYARGGTVEEPFKRTGGFGLTMREAAKMKVITI